MRTQKNVYLSPGRILAVLLVSDMFVLLGHVFLSTKLGFLNLEKEGNLGSLQAGIKFWLAATAAYMAAWITHRSGMANTRIFTFLLVGLGTGLAYIGLDDMMALHERVGFVINNWLGNGGFYGESFNWLLYFSPFVVMALGVFVTMLIQFRKIDGVIFYLFLIGVIACVFSLGAEWLGGGMIKSTNLNVEQYRQLILFEESLEMIGASFMTSALLTLIARLVKSSVRVENPSNT